MTFRGVSMADVNEQQALGDATVSLIPLVPLQQCWPILSTGKLRAIWATV